MEHLAGDFAFAIWDAKTKRLFSARDHFGVKPFYYAEVGEQFIFSNVLDCVRVAPGVPSDLNEAAVGDFLLFGLNCDLATTTFSAIRRLPPAHTLLADAEGVKTACYWAPPTAGRIRYKSTKQYAEHFEEIFREAVRDRLRADRVALNDATESGAAFVPFEATGAAEPDATVAAMGEGATSAVGGTRKR